jgi:phosphoribosyl 1,2-cyclic phosphate phosphodiesterase
LKGVKTLVLDALRHRKHPTHYTLGQAVGVAHEVGAPQTYFIHMAHDLGHAETEASLPEGMRLAYDGLALPDAVAPA